MDITNTSPLTESLSTTPKRDGKSTYNSMVLEMAKLTHLPPQLTRNLTYNVHSFSGFLSGYHPKNILVDKPLDQSSRWSTETNKHKEFLLLELEKPSILQFITFGKFHKEHIQNLRAFKVYAGATLNDMKEILDQGLCNDSVPETFPIRYGPKNIIFPTKFIKISPLASFESGFNFSIWSLKLLGVDDTAKVANIVQQFNWHLEKEAVRLCLKYLRQRNYCDVFQALENRTGIQLEHPQLTELHQKLVVEGNFEYAESLVERAEIEGLFDEYVSNLSYTTQWRRVYASNTHGISPLPRGGHQMCFNQSRGLIYMLGGWDGYLDLSDFWEFNIHTEAWRLISNNTLRQNGPGARSCFKTCFDPIRERIYVFGKYIPKTGGGNCSVASDFYFFDVKSETWTTISPDVRADNGPPLIYDHQMCIDPVNQIIYITGGKAVVSDPSSTYDGMYSYDIATNVWKAIVSIPSQGRQEGHAIRGRISHSMLFDTAKGQLIMLGGERGSTLLSDMFVYDIKTNTITDLYKDYSSARGPYPGFSQSTAFNVNKRELYVMSGMCTKTTTSQTKTICNMIWVYRMDTDSWSEVYKNENEDPKYWAQASNREPRPRFAHQMVYNQVTESHYLFGGNPSKKVEDTARLDDLWELKLIRPSQKEVLRQAKLMLRKHRFLELCAMPNQKEMALNYLRTEVYQLVNHDNCLERKQFQALTANIFSCSLNLGRGTGVSLDDSKLSNHPRIDPRVKLYESILNFYPENMKQPTSNLVETFSLDE